MKKRFVSILAVILCIAVTGCSGGGSDKDNISTVNNSADASESTVANEESNENEHSNFMGVWYFTIYSDPQYAEDFGKIEIVPAGENSAKVIWTDGNSDIIEFVSETEAVGPYQGISKAKYIVGTMDGMEHFNVDVAEGGPIFQMGTGGFRKVPDLYKPKAVRIKNDFQNWFDNVSKKEISSGPQQTMNVESKKIYDEWDRMLNEIYKYLKESMSQSEFAALQKEQQSWVNEKENAIKAQGKEYEGGSMAPLMMNSVGIQYTKERCKYLISLIL